MRRSLRDLIFGTCADLAFALARSRPAPVEPAANVPPDRLRSTLAEVLGFEGVPPDSHIEQAVRHRIARIDELGRRWTACSQRVRVLGDQSVELAHEADALRRQLAIAAGDLDRAGRRLAEREHQLRTAREMLRSGNVEAVDHYLWTILRCDAIASTPVDVEVGGLVHPGALPGEEASDV